MRTWIVGCAVAAALACSRAQPGKAPVDGDAGAAQFGLVKSLEVEVGADTVRFVLHVTNSGTQPVVLEFNSAARYDFEVRTGADSVVWRWSADRMFAQVTGADTIAGGGSRSYRAGWVPGDRSGSFEAIGRVVARNLPIEQRADFELQGR